LNPENIRLRQFVIPIPAASDRKKQALQRINPGCFRNSFVLERGKSDPSPKNRRKPPGAPPGAPVQITKPPGSRHREPADAGKSVKWGRFTSSFSHCQQLPGRGFGKQKAKCVDFLVNRSPEKQPNPARSRFRKKILKKCTLFKKKA
jgi:hypothetical protein